MMQMENQLEVKPEFDIEEDKYILILDILISIIGLRMKNGVIIEHKLKFEMGEIL
jgi:hypothetical protein